MPLTWNEIANHPDLQELPFRVESNRWGQIVLSPLHNAHSEARDAVIDVLRADKPDGRCQPTTYITTDDGVRASAGSWQSDEFRHAHRGEASYSRAPEIVIEVKSPINTMPELLEKKELFLRAGAREVWIRKDNGEMLFYDADEGLRERSRLCPDFPTRVELR